VGVAVISSGYSLWVDKRVLRDLILRGEKKEWVVGDLLRGLFHSGDDGDGGRRSERDL